MWPLFSRGFGVTWNLQFGHWEKSKDQKVLAVPLIFLNFLKNNPLNIFLSRILFIKLKILKPVIGIILFYYL